MANQKLFPLLAIECSGSLLSLAIQTDQTIFTYQQEGQRQHSQWILNEIKNILDKACLSIACIKTIAIGNGPGGFIGVRLAYAVAQALCLPTQKQLLTFSSLQIIAQSLWTRTQAKTIFVAQDARKEEVYACAFQYVDGVMKPILEEKLLTPEKLQGAYQNLTANNALTLIGTGWHAYLNQLDIQQPISILSDCQLAEGALQLALQSNYANTEKLLEPNYLRNHVADLPK